MEHPNRASTTHETLRDLAEAIDACAKLGMRDITVTSMPVEANTFISTPHWRYVLDAKQANPSEQLEELRNGTFGVRNSKTPEPYRSAVIG